MIDVGLSARPVGGSGHEVNGGAPGRFPTQNAVVERVIERRDIAMHVITLVVNSDRGVRQWLVSHADGAAILILTHVFPKFTGRIMQGIEPNPQLVLDQHVIVVE